MCCFTGPVVSVSNTSIFARDAGEGRQYLAYSMMMNSAKEVAMVLPLPVPAKSAEDAVSFIDLSGYAEFFDDLFETMGIETTRAASDHETKVATLSLKVQQVGSFEASFVPSIADFARLDERFRLPAETWDKLPAYRDYGFAVFKLKAGAQTIHPMAFRFPRTDATALYFPTVHIHDGTVHEQAEFDHILYAQMGARLGAGDWNESPGHANGHVDIARTAGMVAGDQHLYCHQLHGKLPNQDTVLKLG